MPVILVYAVAGILALALACLLFGLGVYGLAWSVRLLVRSAFARRAKRGPEVERPSPFPLGGTESATMTL